MYQIRRQGKLKNSRFLLLDIILFEAAMFVSYILRYGVRDFYSERLYLQISIIILFAYLVAQLFMDWNQDIYTRGMFGEFKVVLKQHIVVLSEMIAYIFVTKQSSDYSRKVFLWFAFLGWIFVLTGRVIYKIIYCRYVKKRNRSSYLLIITMEETVQETVNRFLEEHYNNIHIVGIVIYDKLKSEYKHIMDIPVIMGIEPMYEYVKSNVVDEVFLDIDCSKEELESITNFFLRMGIVVHIDIDRISSDLPNKTIEVFGGDSVLTTSVKKATYRQVLIKRCMDILGSLFGLLITGVIFLVFAPIIYIQSPGPIFFSQVRVGKNGRKFKIYKFRSMYPDAEKMKQELLPSNDMKGLMFKMKDDPRVIPIGRLMRKTSLDEFPQFLNILKGDMSLVGTRPPTVDEYEQYDISHRVRLSIKPGLTGLWQVSGRSTITDFEEVVALDQKYIAEWTLGSDVKILLKTVRVVLEGDGAV